MKKLIFTAIAMVAFSGASMANTKEEKKVTIETKKVEALVLRDKCLDAAVAAYQGSVASMGETAAMNLALKVLNACCDCG